MSNSIERPPVTPPPTTHDTAIDVARVKEIFGELDQEIRPFEQAARNFLEFHQKAMVRIEEESRNIPPFVKIKLLAKENKKLSMACPYLRAFVGPDSEDE